MKRFKNTVSAPKKSQRSDDLQVLREAGLLEEDGVALSEPKKDDLDILRAAGLLEEKPKSPKIVSIVKEDKSDDITKKQLNDIEKYADRLFRAVGIDVEFTRHFLDRVNDTRNKKQITPAELIRLFKQSYKKYGKKISKLGAEAQAVINDMRTDINMPFVLEPKGNELELIAKTVMRKKDFKTSNPKLSFESYTKGDTVTTDDALVLKEESLDDFKHPKIEDRPVEHVEGDWKNLAVPSPSPNSSEDTLKELLLSQKLGVSRTEEQEKSVLNHDSSAAYAVKQYMDVNKLSYDKKEFDKVIEAGRGVGRFYKNMFQRPRPWELAEKLNINIHHMEFPSDSMDSPAYPSNHSLQSRLVAEYYAQMYPQHRAQLIKAAEESGVGRVRAGWHYNSDHKAGVTLAEQLVKMINIKTKSTEEFTNILENYQEVLEDAKEKEFNYKLESTLKTLEQQEVSKAASFITEGAPPKEPEKSTEEKLQEQIESLSNLKRDLPNMMATTAGGGSIFLYDLDDVDESTRQDGYFLKYRASDQKFIGEASAVSNETIQDVVGNMVTSNTETGMTVTYEDGDGTLDFVIGTLNQDTTGNAATATTLATARTIGGVSFDGTANINLPGVNTSGNQDTSGTASKATVSDSTANTNFPVVFHDESNGLLDDTGALRYNPSTGELLVPNLTVAGTTTQVDTVTMNAQNAVIFEGATADAHETTLTVTDPTTDRTITLPNATGTVALTSSDITGNAATATALATGRTIGMTGDVVWTSASFDGTGNVTGSATIQANSVDGTMIAVGSDAAGDILYYDGTNYVRLGKGDDDQVLTLASGVPSWAAAGGTSDESIQDVVGAMFSSNTETGITATYQDGDGTIDLVVGTLNQDTTGTAAIATTVTITDNESTNENNALIFTAGGDVDGGNLGLESDGTLTYNPSTGKITATGFIGALTGDVTGDVTGGASSFTSTTFSPLTAIRDAGSGTTSMYGAFKLDVQTTGTPASSMGVLQGLYIDGNYRGEIKVNEATKMTIMADPSSAVSSSSLVLGADGNEVLTIDSGQNATFAGDSTVTGLAKVGDLTLTAGNPEIKTDDNSTVLHISASTAIETGGNIVLVPEGHAAANDIIFQSGTTDVGRWDDSAGKWTFAGDVDVDGDLTFTGAAANVVWDKSVDDLIFADNAKAAFGTGSDLKIFHDGSNSFIQDTGTGALRIDSSSLVIRNSAGTETMATFTQDGAVAIYHDNAIKLATTAAGITVSGGIIIADAGNIGSASDTDAIAIASDGKVTFTQEIIATSLDISGDVDVDGTLETDALTIGGTTLAETIADTVGAMVGSNTETGITVTYQDGDNTLDFAVGTLNQDTTGSAATLTTARSIAMSGDVVWSVSFDGSGNVTAAGTIQSGAVETGMIAADAITAAKIADNAINSEHYTDGSIDTAHIADDQVTEAKMADDAIGSAQLKTLSTLLIKNSGGTTLKTLYGAGA